MFKNGVDRQASIIEASLTFQIRRRNAKSDGRKLSEKKKKDKLTFRMKNTSLFFLKVEMKEGTYLLTNENLGVKHSSFFKVQQTCIALFNGFELRKTNSASWRW